MLVLSKFKGTLFIILEQQQVCTVKLQNLLYYTSVLSSAIRNDVHVWFNYINMSDVWHLLHTRYYMEGDAVLMYCLANVP